MIILDVREKEEFQAEHVAESISCPLSQFDLLAPGIIRGLKDEQITVMCRSGKRANLALNELKKIDPNHHKYSVYDGGILKWKSEGKPLQSVTITTVPVMRQVLMVASTMLLVSFFGYHIIHPGFIYLTLLVGVGLGLAGFFGFCPMMIMLQKMPWNNKKAVVCPVVAKT